MRELTLDFPLDFPRTDKHLADPPDRTYALSRRVQNGDLSEGAENETLRWN